METINQLIRLGKLLEKQQVETLLKASIHKTDIEVLITLKKLENPHMLNPSLLMDSVLLTSGAMTASLNRLERTGLIYRVQDKKDKRMTYACLTKEGLRKAHTLSSQISDHNEKVLEVFDDLEQLQLNKMIRKFFSNLGS